MKRVRVLVVDDDPVMVKLLSVYLGGDEGIEVVGSVTSAHEAREEVLRLKPDVVTLDIQMPEVDGLTFLKALKKYNPVPVVIVSEFSTVGSKVALEALDNGAVDVISKGILVDGGGERGVNLLREKVRWAAETREVEVGSCGVECLGEVGYCEGTVVFVGASTGGVEALRVVLGRMPRGSPPVCVVQHMPAAMTGVFVSELGKECEMEVKVAEEGEALREGVVYVAPGCLHMRLKRDSVRGLYVDLMNTEPEQFHRPAANVLFRSGAEVVGKQSVGVVLTGMGSDGAQGLLAIREAGGRTLGQSEETCVVYGMPRVALELGAVEEVVGLEQMAERIQQVIAVEEKVL